MHDLIPLFIAMLWPATVLILAFAFRREVKQLIASVGELKIFNSVVLRWPQAKVDAAEGESEKPAPKQLTAPPTVKWDKPADLFWLGSDLETTAQTALRGAPKSRIFRGLDQCYHHISEVGLADSAPGNKLRLLRRDVEMLPEPALDRQWRNDFAEKIHSIIQEVSGLVRSVQPGFRPFPTQT
jgi:hypothetical protein